MNLFVGTDIESVDRFKKIFDEDPDSLKKLFFETEYEYAISKANPAQTFTGIWCAKEAVIKLYSTMLQLTTRNVEIVSCLNASPNVLIHRLNICDYNVSISIAHTKDYATATAIALISDEKGF